MGTETQKCSRMNIYLHPGQMFISSEPAQVTTIVGSCVAVCLWDSVKRIGGMNHFLLPYTVENGNSSLRFGNVAVRKLVDRLLKLGSSASSLQAKLFGGACVIEAFKAKEDDLGKQNIRIAREILAFDGIPVISEDVGGLLGRKLIYQTDSGTAWIKLL